MPIKRTHVLGAAVLLAGIPVGAMAQTTTDPSTTGPTDRPAITDPARPSDPAARPADPTRPVITPRTDKSSAAKVNPLIGLAVFSSDGSKLGTVNSVNAEPDGKVKAIHLKTGGFLGFGGKLVAIPEGKFTQTGDNVQLGMTADEVSKLPEVKEQS